MTIEQFEALLVRRDELENEHTTACAILSEEGADRNGILYQRCLRLHAEITEVQEQIDAELEAERAAEERGD